MSTEPRLAPMEPPFSREVSEQLSSMMPPGVPPIALFRTFVKNMPMAEAMHGWGTYELSRRLSVGMREREIVIDRTCAQCGCEYEWGVHVVFFAARAELSDAQVASLTHGDERDPCWTSERDRLLVRLVDQLHESAGLSDDLWRDLEVEFSAGQLLDLTMLTGWYHAISFTARAAGVPLEPGAPTFDSV